MTQGTCHPQGKHRMNPVLFLRQGRFQPRDPIGWHGAVLIGVSDQQLRRDARRVVARAVRAVVGGRMAAVEFAAAAIRSPRVAAVCNASRPPMQ